MGEGMGGAGAVPKKQESGKKEEFLCRRGKRAFAGQENKEDITHHLKISIGGFVCKAG